MIKLRRWMIYPLPVGISHQYKTLASGVSGEIWRFDIPNGHAFFIEAVGSNAFKDSYFIWRVDGEILEDDKIERQMGLMHQPTPISPPILALKNVVVEAYNGDTESHLFEWIHLGHLRYYDGGG